MSMLGALGSFGGGFAGGLETGMDIYAKLREQQESAGAYKAALLDMGGLSQMPGGAPGMGADAGGAPGQQPGPPGAGTAPGAALAASLPSVQGQLGGIQPGMQPAPMGQLASAAGGAGLGMGLPPGVMSPGPIPGGLPGQMRPQQMGNQNIIGSIPPPPGAGAGMQPGGPMSVQPAALAQAREGVRKELESTPGLAAQLDQITTAEVGRDPGMRQRFIETVMNRAAATGQPLQRVLSDRSYFPTATFNRAAQGGTGQGVPGSMFDPVNPSNLTNYGTGNASFDPRTGRYVGFAGGPQTAMRGGEQYGIEGPTLPWAQRTGYTGPTRTGLGPAGPQGSQEPGSPGDIGRVDHRAIQQAQAQGYGPLNIGQAARRIEQVMPNADPATKFGAMKKLYTLMDQQEQRNFQRFMQWNTLRHQQWQEEETARQHQETREHREQQENLSAFKADPSTREIGKVLTDTGNRAANIRVLEDTITKHLDVLSELAKKVNTTPYMPFNEWVNSVKAKFGSAEALNYINQAATARAEIARLMGSATSNAALTEGARQEAAHLVQGVMTPEQITSLKNLIIRDAKIKREASQNLFNQYRTRYNQLAKQYHLKYQDVQVDPISDDPALSAGAGADAGGGTTAPAGGGDVSGWR